MDNLQGFRPRSRVVNHRASHHDDRLAFPPGSPPHSPRNMSRTRSMAPTDPANIFLFYPDWSLGPGGNRCRNDGKTPAYMSANPRDYLSSNLSACCLTWFSWNYDICMSNLPGSYARSLFYPDWDGRNVGCIDDSNEPDYMRDNVMYYMYSQLEDCCQEHYSWNYFECVNTPARLNMNLYYPDWERSDTCRNGGGQPAFMNYNVEIWMYGTLAACCEENYQWIYDECTGSDPISPGTTPASTPGTFPGTSSTTLPGIFYPDWLSRDDVCLNDNKEPTYMANSPSKWMHHTLEACCKQHFPWKVNDCFASSPSAMSVTTSYSGSTGSAYSGSTSSVSTSAAVTLDTGKFYMS